METKCVIFIELTQFKRAPHTHIHTRAPLYLLYLHVAINRQIHKSWYTRTSSRNRNEYIGLPRWLLSLWMRIHRPPCFFFCSVFFLSLFCSRASVSSRKCLPRTIRRTETMSKRTHPLYHNLQCFITMLYIIIIFSTFFLYRRRCKGKIYIPQERKESTGEHFETHFGEKKKKEKKERSEKRVIS